MYFFDRNVYNRDCNSLDEEKETGMTSYLINDTTREERERIIAEPLGNTYGACDGCAAGVAEMYQDYIDGKRELREINREFSARYVSGNG